MAASCPLCPMELMDRASAMIHFETDHPDWLKQQVAWVPIVSDLEEEAHQIIDEALKEANSAPTEG